MKKNSLAHAAALLPLAIGLAMNGVSSRSHASNPSSAEPAFCSQWVLIRARPSLSDMLSQCHRKHAQQE